MAGNASKVRIVLICLALAFVPLVAMAQAGPAKGDASKHFASGVSLFKSGDYEGALVEFRAAYEAKPFFSVRYNIGMSLFKLHRYSEAFEELETYILEGGDGVEEGRSKEVLGILDELAALIGTLDVSCTVDGAKLIVDDESKLFGQLKLDVGEHLVEVTAPGHEPYLHKVSLPGGADLSLAVKLVPLPAPGSVKPENAPGTADPPKTAETDPLEKEPTHLEEGTAGNVEEQHESGKGKKLRPASFYALLATTLVAGSAAVLTGALAVSRRNEYETLTWDDGNWKDVQSSGQNFAVATDILIAATGALAVATIVVALFTDFGSKPKPHKKASLELNLLSAGPGLLIEGRF